MGHVTGIWSTIGGVEMNVFMALNGVGLQV